MHFVQQSEPVHLTEGQMKDADPVLHRPLQEALQGRLGTLLPVVFGVLVMPFGKGGGRRYPWRAWQGNQRALSV